jgi:hypothetical protein
MDVLLSLLEACQGITFDESQGEVDGKEQTQVLSS